ncbi:MAG: proton-conducting transporter membrane subunit, partial [Planctomycetota bacterium]
MDNLLSVVTASIPLVMVALVIIPARVANSLVLELRRAVTVLASVQLGVGVALVGVVAYRSALTSSNPAIVLQPWGANAAGTLWIDGVSALMFLMVSFVGWTICRYSVRYLDGDASQGNFFRWSAFVLGTVSLMVVSGDLITFVMAWIGTSVGLHHLLLHFRDSPAAKRAAWTKFSVIRIGDVALLFAAWVLFLETDTISLREIFASVSAEGLNVVNLQVAAALLVLAAIVKSAQVPFHTWLPQTMETPTPVSALMHAGVINAGG